MEPLYFGPGGRLFGLRSEPAGPARKTAVLICHSWGVEYMRSYRALFLLAQQLAARGFETLRFDYSGTGDSAETSEDTMLDRWIDDIGCAARELRELSGANQICLLGLRLGALLALRAAADGVQAEAAALWDAPESGRRWIGDLQSLDRLHYAHKNRYLPAKLRLQPLPGEILGRRWPEELDNAVSVLKPQAPQAIAQLLHLRSADAPHDADFVRDGEAIKLPDPAHWDDVTWITRPWIPASTQRVIADALAERLQ
jgi:pimeloyl-ACP methyl ester carboxylesterase